MVVFESVKATMVERSHEKNVKQLCIAKTM